MGHSWHHSILLINFVLFTSIFAQKLNEQCQVARSGSIGKCQFFENCPQVVKEISDQGLLPNFCDIDGRKQLVCCPIPPTKRTTTQAPETIRISRKMCAEYQDPLYERSWVSIGFEQKPTEEKVFRCPIASVPFVVGGVDAAPKEFPHMALIGFDDSTKANNISWACGGSLISDQFILTAAHCINGRIGPAKYVLLGDLNLRSDTDDAQPRQFNILETMRHPDYKSPEKYNDIGLIKLTTTVTFNQYIRPACLPESNTIDTEHVIASGWGKLDFDKAVSDSLQKVGLELIAHNECNDKYATQPSRYLRRGILNETQICAGSHDSRKDTCQGDSGGPLQVFHNRLSCMYNIIGVTSFGVSCGIKFPGVYTRVSAYIDWIENVVWPNE